MSDETDLYLEHATIEQSRLGYYVFSEPANQARLYLHSDGRWLNGLWGRTTGYYLSEAAATAALAAARERAKPEPSPAIQLRVGGAYRTTDGSQVEIDIIDIDYAWPARGRIVSAGRDSRSIVGTHLQWCADGRFWQNDELPQDHRWGIVAEWSEQQAVDPVWPVEQLERELAGANQRIRDREDASASNDAGYLKRVAELEQALSECQVERDRLQVTLDRSRQVASELAQRPVKELTARAEAAEADRDRLTAEVLRLAAHKARLTVLLERIDNRLDVGTIRDCMYWRVEIARALRSTAPSPAVAPQADNPKEQA